MEDSNTNELYGITWEEMRARKQFWKRNRNEKVMRAREDGEKIRY